MSSIRGSVYASLTVRLFNFLKSIQNLRLPSFFLTNTTLEEKGLCEGLIASASSISFKCCRTSSNMAGGILRYGSLKGVLSFNFISCFTISAFPRSVGPVEKIWDQFPNVKGRPCGSVAQLAECSHGKREALGSSPTLGAIVACSKVYLL